MAISFVSVNIYSRAKGHSAVAAAAYRSASKLYDERYGVEHNFKSKENVIYTSIMLPDGADEKFRDREFLWNEVEKSETKSNARVSKDIIIALPKELQEKEWIELSRRFAEEQFVSKGVVADLAIHHNEGNPHCHIQVTTRRLLGNKFDKHKARDLDGNVMTSPHGIFSAGNNVYHSEWRNVQNSYFEEKNVDIVVDQNYLISQLHEGKISTDDASYIRLQNQERLIQSKEIALNDPDMVLTQLTIRNTVFSIKDIESMAFKHSDSKEQYNQIKTSVLNNKNLISLGIGLDGREHYTTAYAVKTEYKLINDVRILNTTKNHHVKDKILERIMQGKTLTNEQKEAVKYITQGKDIAVVVGKPGTGKSYMLNTAREAWEASGYNVYGTTVAGIASEGLYKQSGINSKVIASMNYCLEQGYFKFGYKDILVIDEAGMVDTYDMQNLLRHAKRGGAKVVLVGDTKQLQPIGPGAPLRAIIDQTGYSLMTMIRRQDVKWQKEASYKLSRGDFSAIDLYMKNDRLKVIETQGEAISKIISDWSSQTRPQNLIDSIITAHRNVDINTLNDAARLALINRGILDKKTFKTFDQDKGKLEIGIGEKVLFTKNDYGLNVKNGTFGIVTGLGENTVCVDVKMGSTRRSIEVNLDEYKHLSHGYAATVHKLQGATIDKAYIYFGGRAWNRNLTLVALTRHKKDAFLYADKETHRSFDSLKNSLSRENFKDSVLSYPISFSLRRGINPESVAGKAIDKLAGIGEKITDKWLWLVNHQPYLEKQKVKERYEFLKQNQAKAKIVAKFIDLKSELLTTRMQLQKESTAKIPFYSLPRYEKYYRDSVILDKLGSHVYRNYEKFESVCSYNNLNIADFKRYYENNERLQTVKSFLSAYEKNNSEEMQVAFKAIQDSYKKHYKFLVQESKGRGHDLKSINTLINKHSHGKHNEQINVGSSLQLTDEEKTLISGFLKNRERQISLLQDSMDAFGSSRGQQLRKELNAVKEKLSEQVNKITQNKGLIKKLENSNPQIFENKINRQKTLQNLHNNKLSRNDLSCIVKEIKNELSKGFDKGIDQSHGMGY